VDAGNHERFVNLPPYPTPPSWIYSIEVSPNRHWLAYYAQIEYERHLFIVDTSGDVQTDLLIVDQQGQIQMGDISRDEPGQWGGKIYWLDNERLMTEMRPPPSGWISMSYSAIMYNPFTGEIKEYPPAYPDISDRFQQYFEWDISGYTGMVFNSQLTRVIYGTMDDEVVLWDIENNQELLRLPPGSLDHDGPVWNQSGTSLAIALSPQKDEENKTKDLFIITQDGQMDRITYFSQEIRDGEIGLFRWSPDDQKIAFHFVSYENEICPESGTSFFPGLVDLDLPGFVQVFCTPNIDPRFPPIWSPNGEYIVYQMRSTIPYEYSYILLNWEEGFAVHYEEDGKGVPVGWMIDE
jgi:hypothetical protein